MLKTKYHEIAINYSLNCREIIQKYQTLFDSKMLQFLCQQSLCFTFNNYFVIMLLSVKKYFPNDVLKALDTIVIAGYLTV